MHYSRSSYGKQTGFTIIELLVTIVIISLLSTIITLSYVRIQRGQSDTTRDNKVIILKDALERYYDVNGEYPSNKIMNESTDVELAKLLKVEADGITLDTVVIDPATDKFLPVSTLGTAQGRIGYKGTTPGGTSGDENLCLYQINGGCFKYALRYETELSGIKTIESEH